MVEWRVCEGRVGGIRGQGSGGGGAGGERNRGGGANEGTVRRDGAVQSVGREHRGRRGGVWAWSVHSIHSVLTV